MKKKLRRHAPGYALGSMLLLLGLAGLFWVFWKNWPRAQSNPLSVFWVTLWVEKLVLLPGFEFELVYLFVFLVAMLIASLIVFGLSRQWLPLGGRDSRVECPFCRKHWRTSPDKALGICPYCRQLVHPKLVDG